MPEPESPYEVLLRLLIKIAPRDVARLQALLEGHDGLGALAPLDSRAGLFVLDVPSSLRSEAERALAAAAGRVPHRLLSVSLEK